MYRAFEWGPMNDTDLREFRYDATNRTKAVESL
jgi:hypothetical protein